MAHLFLQNILFKYFLNLVCGSSARYDKGRRFVQKLTFDYDCWWYFRTSIISVMHKLEQIWMQIVLHTSERALVKLANLGRCQGNNKSALEKSTNTLIYPP